MTLAQIQVATVAQMRAELARIDALTNTRRLSRKANAEIERRIRTLETRIAQNGATK